jgi:hypothetical protein
LREQASRPAIRRAGDDGAARLDTFREWMGQGLPWHSRQNSTARLRRVAFHGNEEENMRTNFVPKMSQKYG